QRHPAAAFSRKLAHLFQHFFNPQFRSAVESIGRIAPRTTEIASRQPDEDARQSGACALSLDGFEDFRDDHFGFPEGFSARIPFRSLAGAAGAKYKSRMP